MAAVFLAETIYQVVLVFVDAPLQIIRHSNVERARSAGDHVDAVVVSFHCGSHKQVPALRIAIDNANRNAPVGMTELLTAESSGSLPSTTSPSGNLRRCRSGRSPGCIPARDSNRGCRWLGWSGGRCRARRRWFR